MRPHHDPIDVADAQWQLIEPHIPSEPGGGRPRKTEMWDVLDATLYITRTGYQWRNLPGEFRHPNPVAACMGQTVSELPVSVGSGYSLVDGTNQVVDRREQHIG